MFFKDDQYTTNITTATPERVFMLFKVVNSKNGITNRELKEIVEPSYAKNDNYFTTIREIAKELELIVEDDNYLSSNPKCEKINSIVDLRKYINANMDKFQGGAFYAITSSYFKLNQKVFSEFKNIAELSSKFSDLTNMNITVEGIRAWRFWASFLGLGYLDGMVFLPNAAIFLRDVLESKNYARKIQYSIDEIIDDSFGCISIIMEGCKENRCLNYGTTCGLLTLEDSKFVKIYDIMDHEIFNLFKIILGKHKVTNIEFLK